MDSLPAAHHQCMSVIQQYRNNVLKRVKKDSSVLSFIFVNFQLTIFS